jgi:hypothetical protein
VGGISTIGGDAGTTLTTKDYVDGVLVTSHGDLTDLLDDTHTQYMTNASTRPFTTIPYITDTAGDPDFGPVLPYDLVTKEYVDDGIATLGDLELFNYVDVFGRHEMTNNQIYTARYELNPFLLDRANNLVPKDYVDDYIARLVISDTDEDYGYFVDKLEFTGATTAVVYNGSATGIVVDKSSERLGGIRWVQVDNGGTGFFVYDPDGTYPATFLDVTNDGIFDDLGASGNDLTETQVSISSAGTNADIRVRTIIGDIEYMEIVDGGTDLSVASPDSWYSFIVTGDGYQVSTWTAFVTNGGASDGVITAVKRDITTPTLGIGAGYSRAPNVTDILNVTSTFGFTLRPFIIGAITQIAVTGLGGDGYTDATYNITGSTPWNGGVGTFIVTGEGTTPTDVGSLDVTFHNPINEKLKLSHFGSGVLEGVVGASPFAVTTGNIITGFEFDEYGHFTSVQQSALPSATWEIKTGAPLAAFELEYNKSYFVDVSSSNVIVTLPDEDFGGVGLNAPVLGDSFIIDDYENGTESSTPRYIRVQPHANQGGNLLVNSSATTEMDIDVAGSRVEFTYVDGTYGWRYKVI